MNNSGASGSVVGIHQPNFFPWLGFFAKLAASDVFVLLDDVQLPRGSGTWVNRVKLLTDGAGQWVTAAIHRPDRDARINQIAFAPDVDWQAKLLRGLRSRYARAPHFRETMDLLEPLVQSAETSLSRYNSRAITIIAEAIGLADRRIVSSSALPSQGAATERLISLVQAVGGTTYLSGDGASGYQEDALFEQAGLALDRLHFEHPIYEQAGKAADFVPGLSIIDALMNVGAGGVQALLSPYSSRRGEPR